MLDYEGTFRKIQNSKRMRQLSNLISFWLISLLFYILYNSKQFSKKNVLIDKHISMMIGIMILKESLIPSVFVKILEFSMLRFLGKISYPLYLLHPIVLEPLKKSGTLTLGKQIFIILASFGLATFAIILYFQSLKITCLKTTKSSVGLE